MQNSLPLPNFSRTIWIISSAWLSILAKINVLGTSLRLGNRTVFECADLAGIDDVPIQLRGGIVHIPIQLLPAFGSREPVAALNHLLHQIGAVFAHLGLDEENILAHVHTVNDGLLPGVFADLIFVEKGEGGLVRGSGQAHDKGVEILQHLDPDVVNGAVAFIHDSPT